MKSIRYFLLLLAAATIGHAVEPPAQTPDVIAAPAPAAVQIPSAPALPAPHTLPVAVSTILLVDGIFLFCLLMVAATLRRDPSWSLAQALAESTGAPEPKPGGTPALGARGLQGVQVPAGAATTATEPKIEYSASRLIAFIGMLAVVAAFVGMANCFLWYGFMSNSTKAESDAITAMTGSMFKFLAGGAALFVPYMANQLRSAFESFGTPPPK